jgi:23S rRNA (guanosine2251-2'-O)-methyltransferase
MNTRPGRPVSSRATAGPSTAGPSAAGPSAAGPSAAGPSAAGPSAAGPSADAAHGPNRARLGGVTKALPRQHLPFPAGDDTDGYDTTDYSREPVEDTEDSEPSVAPAGSRGAARFVPGIQPVREALRAGTQLDKVFVNDGPSRDLEALARFATDRGVLVEYVSRARLDSMTRGGRHQGVVALAKPFVILGVDDLELGPATLGIALDELEDPQNFGAIIRSTVALGGDFVLWPEHHAAPLSMATVRASAGAIEHARLCRVPKLPAALNDLRKRGVMVVGLDMSGDRMLADCTLTGPTVLVIGAEGKGLRRPVKDACDVVAKLPMTASIASLNASVAAGISLYEVGRSCALSVLPNR